MKRTTQQLRQTIREESENILAKNEPGATLPDSVGFGIKKGFQKGDLLSIKPDTELKVGQDVVTMTTTQFGRISKIVGDKYTITWADYGDKVRQTRQKLERLWLLVQSGRDATQIDRD